jgi:pyrroloquinoline quinone biosynthesis protein B
LGSIRARARTQAQLAISEGEHWFLLGASPDLRSQIEGSWELHPRTSGRNSPIAGVTLLSADLDHTLGLLLMREWQRLNVYSTPAVQSLLLKDNTIFRLLQRMPDQIRWINPEPNAQFALEAPNGTRSQIFAEFFHLGGGLPAYAPEGSRLNPEESVSALFLESRARGRLAYIPGLPTINEELFAKLDTCQTILVDGTFWTNDELIRIEGFGKLARDIGHTPVSGSDGSLAQLSRLQGARKIYIHVNNTNPMLDEDSSEYAAVLQDGWEIAFDGMELEI